MSSLLMVRFSALQFLLEPLLVSTKPLRREIKTLAASSERDVSRLVIMLTTSSHPPSREWMSLNRLLSTTRWLESLMVPRTNGAGARRNLAPTLSLLSLSLLPELELLLTTSLSTNTWLDLPASPLIDS